MRARGVGIVVTCLLIAGGCAARRPAPSIDERFDRAVREYLEMRAAAIRVAGPVSVTDNAPELTTTVDALASRLQNLRAGLNQGVLFPQPLADRIRQNLAARLSEPDGPQLRSRLTDVEAPPQFEPRVNQRYPEGTVRTSTPTALLEVLPPVPGVLSYRFVGRDLLLLDRTTGVVLDIVPDALLR